MWKIAPAVDENDVPLQKNRRAAFTKKHPDEVNELDAMVDEILAALNIGYPLKTALAKGFVGPEPCGVFRVGTNRPALRLYFLPLPERETLLTLTIGDKKTQWMDIRDVTAWAKAIRGE